MKRNFPAEAQTVRIGRRTFLRLGVIGGGASILALVLPSGVLRAANTDALLLSCKDYRLIDETERYMSGRGLQNRYDHIILAGVSLGALTVIYPAWNSTFWEHLDVAIQLHQIHKVIVLDHRDCGAYKVILGEDFSKDPARKTAVHDEKLNALNNQIQAKYPSMEVELVLMNLNGAVANIA